MLSVLALLLSAVGIYSVIAYDVGSRIREFGIRSALGADSGRLMGSVLRRALAVTGAGVVAGLLLGSIAARLLRTFLFGVTPGDFASILLAPTLLSLVALLATIAPARRALRVEPAMALRIDRP